MNVDSRSGRRLMGSNQVPRMSQSTFTGMRGEKMDYHERQNSEQVMVFIINEICEIPDSIFNLYADQRREPKNFHITREGSERNPYWV
jgi:hypothetical protein